MRQQPRAGHGFCTNVQARQATTEASHDAQIPQKARCRSQQPARSCCHSPLSVRPYEEILSGFFPHHICQMMVQSTALVVSYLDCLEGTAVYWTIYWCGNTPTGQPLAKSLIHRNTFLRVWVQDQQLSTKQWSACYPESLGIEITRCL